MEIAGGTAIALFVLAIVGLLRVGPLERVYTLRLPERLRRRGVAGAYLVGAVFGLGWTPCVGPYLAAALTLAAVSSHAATGALLLAVYAIGLGLPFVLVALLWGSLPQLPRRLTRLARPLTVAGGLMTVALGLLVATGAYSHVTSYLAQLSTPR